MSVKAQSTKEKTGKLDFINIKSLCSTKDAVKRMKKQAKDWEKIPAKHISNNGFVSRIHNELPKFKIRKQRAQFKNRQKI